MRSSELGVRAAASLEVSAVAVCLGVYVYVNPELFCLHTCWLSLHYSELGVRATDSLQFRVATMCHGMCNARQQGVVL